VSTILKALKRLEEEKTYEEERTLVVDYSRSSSNTIGAAWQRLVARYGWAAGAALLGVIAAVTSALLLWPSGSGTQRSEHTTEEPSAETSHLVTVAIPPPAPPSPPPRRVKPHRTVHPQPAEPLKSESASVPTKAGASLPPPTRSLPTENTKTDSEAAVMASTAPNRPQPAPAPKQAPMAQTAPGVSAPPPAARAEASDTRPSSSVNPPPSPPKAPSKQTSERLASLAPPAKAEPEEPPAVVQAPPPIRKPDPYARVEPLPKGEISIQAISWADEPQARIAVMDNKILREGENVGEMTIVEIRKDDVVVRQAGRLWRVVFNLR
jgi:general secretion pathway protein B